MIIGLTGSIATGKSTVATYLAEKGLPIIDADKIARQIVQPGSLILQQLQEAFGEEIVDENGSLKREQLGALIFQDAVKRQLLNKIMHPAIRQEMLRQRDQWVAQGRDVVLDIPLLFESNLQGFVEKIMVVACSREQQLERLMKRNQLTEQEATERVDAQMSIEEKVALADGVIHNIHSKQETYAQVDNVLAKWGLMT